MTIKKHRVDSIYVNAIPVWQYRRCGLRWDPSLKASDIEKGVCSERKG